MLYYLFDYLDREFDFIGAGVFHYISFRAGAATFLSLLISTIYGKKIILYLRRKQIGEGIRDLGLSGQMEKKGTPTMGGLIIILSIVVPTLLFAKLDNIYVILLLLTLIGLGFIGFLDDYLKIAKKNKEGLSGKFKIVGQVGIGLVVGITLYYNSNVVVQEKIALGEENKIVELQKTEKSVKIDTIRRKNEKPYYAVSYKSTKTNVPFFKNNEFDYNVLNILEANWLEALIYVGMVIFIITAVSNGANITDGIDGLAAGTSGIIGLTLAIFAYLSGNLIFADYLNILYIPHMGEVVIFATAFAGACAGFLWYNAYPAQVFMGDTGSLALGGVIAVLAIAVRKELMIPVLCGIFFAENLSVILQVAYFKYQKKKRGLEYAQKNRLFLMAPLHHHYQKKGYHETKIVVRFWIVGILLAIFCLVTLKLR
ncbi:phospho-N-acetylmuramoyl-pentapeptide-transferase [Raineya orbicola]|jgi:phospho-N-acetylmuramoyl-pentapeptide-transferase|uniref:Phospho-N-acetylmuramoyl-pentapeptide-transferase n=1 Tax=Raineya orbicola TaxID=2016530 RepID=A0A2N3IHZ7_9BACT|nr:phospho-N-acetylmuramoyl-pentapeptide-transferase [Raineya orbicola]PKQ69916.1 mraY: phospho-N-acetylmuramoyl-pentapeptide-transferase [Raineya orbicola]